MELFTLLHLHLILIKEKKTSELINCYGQHVLGIKNKSCRVKNVNLRNHAILLDDRWYWYHIRESCYKIIPEEQKLDTFNTRVVTCK